MKDKVGVFACRLANGGVIDANLVEGPSQTRAGTDVAAEEVANKVLDEGVSVVALEFIQRCTLPDQSVVK